MEETSTSEQSHFLLWLVWAQINSYWIDADLADNKIFVIWVSKKMSFKVASIIPRYQIQSCTFAWKCVVHSFCCAQQKQKRIILGTGS